MQNTSLIVPKKMISIEPAKCDSIQLKPHILLLFLITLWEIILFDI